MEEFLRQLLEETSGGVAYATIFGVLVACGMGIPLPEDISLILGGYLAYLHAVKLPFMMLVGFVGILCGDSIIFTAGRRMGNSVSRGGFFSRIVTPEKRARVERLFKRHGEKIVMIARFMPGVRAVTYFSAGAAGMRYTHFIFWDGMAALLSAPLFVFLGFHFGDDLEILIHKMKHGEKAVLIGLATLIVAYLIWTYIRKRREKAELARTSLEKPAPTPEAAKSET